jgi:lysozyme
MLQPTGPALKTPDEEKSVSRPAATEEEADLSRAQRFRMVQQETLKWLGPSALIAALPRKFVFPHSRDDAIFGIDVSHHNQKNCQCDIDWARVARAQVTFVVAKATEGIRFRDPHFKGHWEELARVPEIYRGAYHFMSADDDPVEQANYFLATLGPLRAVDMPPVLDLEWDVVVRSTRKWAKRDGDYWSQLSPDEILDRVLKWLDVVEKRTGRIPMIYTSRAWWAGRIKSDAKLALLKRYPIWLSAMEEKDLQVERPGTRGGWAGKWPWTLWQFTNRGDLTIAGIPNPSNPRLEGFDVNLFRGSVAEFRMAMGIHTPIVVAEPTTRPASGTGSAAQDASPTKSVAESVTRDAEQPKEAAKEPSQETPKSETKVAAVVSDAAKFPEALNTGTTPESVSTGAAAGPAREAANEPASEAPTQAAKEPAPEAPQVMAKDPTPEPPPAAPKAETKAAVEVADAAKPTETVNRGATAEAARTDSAAGPPKAVTAESAAAAAAAATPNEEAKRPAPIAPNDDTKLPVSVPQPLTPKTETEDAAAPGSINVSKPQSAPGVPVALPTPSPAATEPNEIPPMAGPPKDATPKDATPKDATPKDAPLKEGPLRGGLPSDGPPKEGPPKDRQPKEAQPTGPDTGPATKPAAAPVTGPATGPGAGPATGIAATPTAGAGSGRDGAAVPNVQGTDHGAAPVVTSTAALTGSKITGPGPSPSIIEIVLPNGRLLRVHIDTDPQVLMRFIAVLEK